MLVAGAVDIDVVGVVFVVPVGVMRVTAVDDADVAVVVDDDAEVAVVVVDDDAEGNARCIEGYINR